MKDIVDGYFTAKGSPGDKYRTRSLEVLSQYREGKITYQQLHEACMDMLIELGQQGILSKEIINKKALAYWYKQIDKYQAAKKGEKVLTDAEEYQKLLHNIDRGSIIVNAQRVKVTISRESRRKDIYG